MPIGRRALLYGGSGIAASLAAGAAAATWRRARALPSPTRGIICSGTSSSPVPVSTPVPVRAPLHPEALARFVDPLPLPTVIDSKESRDDPRGGRERVPYYRVSMREGEMRIHRDVPPTRIWSYGGGALGPTFETRSGRGLMVEWANDLPRSHFLPIDRTLHGAHDGQPDVRAVPRHPLGG